MRILLVEDNEKTVELVTSAFRAEGHECVSAFDGLAGLELAKRGGFDVIVTDVMMPKMDGVALVSNLRSEGIKTPVLVLSAVGSVENKVAGFAAGGDDYLSKPFSMQELLVRVQALHRRAMNVVESDVLQIDDLEMDLVTHRVMRGGRRIDLQPLEYQLLEYLLRNRGRVIDRTTVMEQVWDYHFDPHTNIVETRVCRLRDKIDKGHERKLIRTVRGFGYIID